MTMQKKYIEDENGNKVLPITHFSAVKNSSGDTLEDVLYTESTYDPTTYSGMGRKVLQKNMVNGVNTLTQDMMPVATGGNTIYIIRYDFTLGENVTVPADCVLEFDGGSISGAYTITGNNTTLYGNITIWDSISFSGSFTNDVVYADWIKSSSTDESIIINKAIGLSSRAGRVTKLSRRTYTIYNPIILSHNLTLSGAAIECRETSTRPLVGSIISAVDTDGIVLHNNVGTSYKIAIENIGIKGNSLTNVGIHFIPVENVVSALSMCRFENLDVSNFEYGVKIDSIGHAGISANIFDRVFCHNNKIGLMINSIPLEGSEDTRSAWVNTNKYYRCAFNENTVGGVWYKGTTSNQNNHFLDCTIEMNGYDYLPEDLSTFDHVGFAFYGNADTMSGNVTFELCYFENNYPNRTGIPTENEFEYNGKVFPNNIESDIAAIHISKFGVKLINCHIGRTTRLVKALVYCSLTMLNNSYSDERFCPYADLENCNIDHMVYIGNITTTKSTTINIDEFWESNDGDSTINGIPQFVKFDSQINEYAKRFINLNIKNPIDMDILWKNAKHYYTMYFGGNNAAPGFSWGLDRSYTIPSFAQLASAARPIGDDIINVRVLGNVVIDNSGSFKIIKPIVFTGESNATFATNTVPKEFYNDVTFISMNLRVVDSEQLITMKGGNRVVFRSCTINLASLSKSIVDSEYPINVEFYNCTFEVEESVVSASVLYPTHSKGVNVLYYNCTFPTRVSGFNTLHEGTTSTRPALINGSFNGYQYFDTTLGKPIYWNGTAWVDATGATV